MVNIQCKSIGFKGNIPAFSRLAIIYEKSKEYGKAVAICDMAIRYYKRWDLETSEFEDRKNKLLDKNKTVKKFKRVIFHGNNFAEISLKFI